MYVVNLYSRDFDFPIQNTSGVFLWFAFNLFPIYIVLYSIVVIWICMHVKLVSQLYWALIISLG